MVKIYNYHTNELVITFRSYKMAENWITRCAGQWNCGIYRMWREGARKVFDVGPRVYYFISQE